MTLGSVKYFILPSISKTPTKLISSSGTLRPISLSKTAFNTSLVSMFPFTYISASPSWTNLTAYLDISVLSFKLTIWKSEISISASSAIFLIFSSFPIRIESPIFISLAKREVFKVSGISAPAIAIFFIFASFLRSASNLSKVIWSLEFVKIIWKTIKIKINADFIFINY